jgi:serine/threonine protein kinase
MIGGSRATGEKAQAPDPLLGKVLNGRFTILETLGSGGMGRVYKAMQTPLDRIVALKVLNPNYGGGRDPGFQKRFLLEASMTAKLHHPNTITVIDYGKTEDGIYFIAMEYVEGKTLARVIAEEAPLPWVRALHITQQICRSLREAHRHGIIHRDLKPANVMVVNEETDHDLIKVLDFGLVKSFLPEHKDITNTELTQAGVLLGSPMYMAPEQARNHADPRSDVYSLGVVFYQMLAGKPPFSGKEAIDVILKHVNEPPPRLATTAPGVEVPAEIEALVMKCLAKKPADRFQSMDEMLEGLRACGANVGMSGIFSKPRSMVISQPRMTPPRPPPLPDHTRADGPNSLAEDGPTSNTRARRRLILAASGGGALALCLVIITFVVRKPSAPPPRRSPTVTPRVDLSKADPVKEPGRNEPPRVATTAPPFHAGPVRFRVHSDPEGARVNLAGKEIGETPLEFDLPPDDSGRASALLSFSLEGYAHATVTAEGEGPEVSYTHRMTRLPQPLPQKKAKGKSNPNTPGYKDDPYQ